MVSSFFSAISLASMGIFFYFQDLWGDDEATATLGWLPLLSLIVFFIAYSCGMSNVPFIIMGEMFPTRFRTLLGTKLDNILIMMKINNTIYYRNYKFMVQFAIDFPYCPFLPSDVRNHRGRWNFFLLHYLHTV